MAKEQKIFVRIQFTGFIDVIRASGPFNRVAVTVEELKEMVRRGYDVTPLCRNANPELYDIIMDYRAAVQAEDRDKMRDLQIAMFRKNPNSVTEKAISAASTTPDTSTPVTDVTADALKKAGLDKEVKKEGVTHLSGGNPSPNGNLQQQMESLQNSAPESGMREGDFNPNPLAGQDIQTPPFAGGDAELDKQVNSSQAALDAVEDAIASQEQSFAPPPADQPRLTKAERKAQEKAAREAANQ